MSTDINNGGPAFPRGPFMYGSDGRMLFNQKDQTDAGMTLRDYFAASALSGLLASFGADAMHPGAKETHAEHIAKHSYAIADAMLKARQ